MRKKTLECAPTIKVLLQDNALWIRPAYEDIKKFLTIQIKSLELGEATKWKKAITYKDFEAYRIATGSDGVSNICTYQGLWVRILKYCEDRYEVEFMDRRVMTYANGTLPKPAWKSMYGFRGSQEKLLKDFLSKDQSGILVAPTRYGKTTLIINTLRAHPTLRTVVTMPGVDLINQTYEDVKTQLKGRDVVKICTGSRTRYQGPDITICSMDSLAKCDVGGTDLLLIDEPHASVTDRRLPLIDSFTKARRLAFGATPEGRFDGKDILIEAVCGPVLVEKTYKEAVEEGAICPIHAMCLHIPLAPEWFRDRDAALSSLLFENETVASIVSYVCRHIIPEDYQTLIFIQNEKQADHLLERLGTEGTIAMAKKLSAKERARVTKLVCDNVIKRCIASNIFVQGVTFHDLRVLINCAGGGNNTTAIQKPGRLAEMRKGKKCGVLIDIMFIARDWGVFNRASRNQDAWTFPIRDSLSRRTAYINKGYEIHDVYSLKELKSVFDVTI